jgi:nitrogen fixation NifU-like protein
MADDLYREIILEHYKNPENRGEVKGGIEMEEANTLCGDKIKIGVKIKDGIISEAKFQGGGCAISMAAADILMGMIKGKRLSEVQKMSGHEVEKIMGVELSSSRKKCAYLGLEVLKKIK